jgi:plasmid stabilization system protein ParE
MNRLPAVEYTKEARRDLDRCRQFLRRHSPANAWQRTREIVGAIRRIRENPEMNPVRRMDPDTGLHLRRCNVAQFVIVYVYFGPEPSKPRGLISLRAFRHAGEEDVFWEVRDSASWPEPTRGATR